MYSSVVGEMYHTVPIILCICFGHIIMKICLQGAYGCILDLICSDIWFGILFGPHYFWATLYLSGDWACVHCSPFTFWELATPPIWGHPSYCIWYSEDSPPNTWLRWCDTVCLNICLAWGKLLTSTLTFCWIFVWAWGLKY